MQFSHMYSSALDFELGTDDSTRLFTTARRQSAINEGVLEFADLTECFTRQSTIVSSHGVGEYNLFSTVSVPGNDFLRLSKQRPEYQLLSSHGGSSAQVTYSAGDNFERREVDWLNTFAPGWRDSTAGQPAFYYERSDGGRRFFGLFPPPEIGSSESGKVVLPYVAKPQTLTSDTDVPFTIASTAVGASTGVRNDLEPWHQAAVHYAAYKLEKLRVHHQESQQQMQIFLGYVTRYLQEQTPKGGQTIRHARSYFQEVQRRRLGGAELPKPMTGWNYGG